MMFRQLIFFLGLAGLAAALAMADELVIVSLMLSFGLLFPVWIVAANMWWVLLLVLGWRLASLRLGPVMGAALVAVPVLALAGWDRIDTARQIAEIRQALPEDPPQRAEGVVRSLEYSSEGDDWGNSFDPHETCDPLCFALMEGGGLDWLRLERFVTVDAARLVRPAEGYSCADLSGEQTPEGCLRPARVARMTTIIARVDAAECRASLADFPDDAPCLRFMADDGRKADLRLILTAGNQGERKALSRRTVTVTSQRGLAVLDSRGEMPVVLARASSLSYDIPRPVPVLLPSANINRSEHRLRRWTESHRERAPDAALMLAQVGLALAAVRPDERHHVFPGARQALSPTIRALADSRGPDVAAIWTRHNPPDLPKPAPRKSRSPAEIEAARRASEAAQQELLQRWIMEGDRQEYQ